LEEGEAKCLDRAMECLLFLDDASKQSGNLASLPLCVQGELEAALNNAIAKVNGLHDPPELANASAVVAAADTLYALCLQYGLLAAGSSSDKLEKERQEETQKLATIKDDLEALEKEAKDRAKSVDQIGQDELKKLRSDGEQAIKRIQDGSNEALGQIADGQKEFTDKSTKLTEALETQSQDRGKQLAELAEQHKAKLKEGLDSAVSNLQQEAATFSTVAKEVKEGIGAATTQSQTLRDAVKTLRDEAQQLLGSTQNHHKVAKETLDAIVATQGKAQSESEAMAKLRAEAEGAIKAMNDSRTEASELQGKIHAEVTEAVASNATIAKLKEDIGVFFDKIEEHRTTMRQTKAKADQDFRDLCQSTEGRVETFENRAEDVVSKNEELQKQVDEILGGARGGELFTEFNQRKKAIVWKVWLWFGSTIVAFTAMIGSVLWLIWKVGEVGSDLGWLASRATLGLPLGGFLWLCISQYAKERRLEEEYAFKAVISLSLESYRKLLVVMSKETEKQNTEFVKELMLKAFKNPALVLRPT